MREPGLSLSPRQARPANPCVLARSRPSNVCLSGHEADGRFWPARALSAPDRPRGLDPSLLRDLKSVIDLDTEVAHCAFELGVTQQQLDCTKVLSPSIHQRWLSTPN